MKGSTAKLQETPKLEQFEAECSHCGEVTTYYVEYHHVERIDTYRNERIVFDYPIYVSFCFSCKKHIRMN